MALRSDRSICLFGQPGTGKKTIAKAIREIDDKHKVQEFIPNDSKSINQKLKSLKLYYTFLMLTTEGGRLQDTEWVSTFRNHKHMVVLLNKTNITAELMNRTQALFGYNKVL